MKKTGKVFYILPAGYLAVSYTALIFLLKQEVSPLPVLAGAALLLGVGNMIQAVLCCRKKHEEFLERAVMLLKYGMILFYMIVFVLGVAVWFIGTFLGPVGMIAALMFAIVDYAIMIPGIFYGISWLVLLIRKKEISLKAGTFHGILQCLFVFDVADTMYLIAVKKKKYRRITAGILVMTVAAAGVAGVFFLCVGNKLKIS